MAGRDGRKRWKEKISEEIGRKGRDILRDRRKRWEGRDILRDRRKRYPKRWKEGKRYLKVPLNLLGSLAHFKDKSSSISK